MEGSLKWSDESKALHWIDRYAAGIDADPQMDRILECVDAGRVEVTNVSAMALLIKRSIAFADWAAGEGISPSAVENYNRDCDNKLGEDEIEDLDPDNFLYAYSQATGDKHWLSLASRISKAFEDLKQENSELRQQLFLTAEKLTREGVEELRSEFEYQQGAEEEFRNSVQRLYRERGW